MKSEASKRGGVNTNEMTERPLPPAPMGDREDNRTKIQELHQKVQIKKKELYIDIADRLMKNKCNLQDASKFDIYVNIVNAYTKLLQVLDTQCD